MQAFRAFHMHFDSQVTAYLFVNVLRTRKALNRGFVGSSVAYVLYTVNCSKRSTASLMYKIILLFTFKHT